VTQVRREFPPLCSPTARQSPLTEETAAAYTNGSLGFRIARSGPTLAVEVSKPKDSS